MRPIKVAKPSAAKSEKRITLVSAAIAVVRNTKTKKTCRA